MFRKLVTVLVEQNRIRAREIDARLHADKRVVSQKFFRYFMGLLRSRAKSGRGSVELTARQIKDLEDLKTDLMIWSSPSVIAAWNRMERASLTPGQHPVQMLLAMENVMRSMRADLGHDDSELPPGEIVALFLNPEGNRKSRVFSTRPRSASYSAVADRF